MKMTHLMHALVLASMGLSSAGHRINDAFGCMPTARGPEQADRAEWLRAARGTPWSQWGAWARARSRRRRWKR